MSARATDEQFLAKSNTGSSVITRDGDTDLGLAPEPSLCPCWCLLIPRRIFLRGEKATFLFRAFWKFLNIAQNGYLCLHPPHPPSQPGFKQLSINSLQDCALYFCHSCLWCSTTLGLDLPSVSQLAGRCQEPTVAQDSSWLCWSAEKKKSRISALEEFTNYVRKQYVLDQRFSTFFIAWHP